MAIIPFASLFPMLMLTLGGHASAQNPAPEPGTPSPKAEQPRIDLGDALPASLVLHDLAGKAHDLGKMRGKVVVLHFWSKSCPWEKLAEPKLNELALGFDSDDVQMFGIASNQNEIGSKPDPKEFEREDAAKRPYADLRNKAKEVAMNHDILADHGAALGKRLAAKTTPHCFVFDQKGVLVYAGALDDNGRGKAKVQHLENAIEQTLAGEPVTVNKTRPYG